MRPKKVILVVDANEQHRSVRTFLLETRGYRVITAETADQALDILAGRESGTLDLLLTDLLLPGTDGNMLARKAKGLHPNLPVLITSNLVVNFDRASAADAFLPKGASSPVELLERIRVLVARRRGPKSRVAVPTTQQVAA